MDAVMFSHGSSDGSNCWSRLGEKIRSNWTEQDQIYIYIFVDPIR